MFKSVPSSVITRQAPAATRRPLTRGERLLSKGDAPTGMYIVVYGSVRLISPSPRGDRQPAWRRLERVFGEPIMFLKRPAVVHAIAAEDSLVLHLPREAVVAEIEGNPAFAMPIIRTLSPRAEALVQQLESQAAGSARERLVAYLVRHAPAVPPHVVVLPSTKASIASSCS